MNDPRWTPGELGHYEVWYLTIADRESGHAFWIRYTIHAPKHGEAHAALWFARFAPAEEAQILCGKNVFDANSLRVRKDRFGLELPGGALSNDFAVGRIESQSGPLSWDLTFPDQGPWLYHMPQFLYGTRAMKTKVLSPHLDLPMTGVIEVPGRRYTLTNAPGEQSHVWGSQHGHEWCWAHCNAFQEGEGILEGIAARLAFGPIRTPWISVFFLKREGKAYHLNDLLGAHHRRNWILFPEWRFSAQGRDVSLEGTWRAPEDRTVEALYEDPNGEELSCYNSCLATLSLRVRPRAGEPFQLTSTAAALEFGVRPRGRLARGMPTM